jgi:hypothetical protein
VPLPTCIGNCNGDASVTIDELVVMVGITLDTVPRSSCPEGLPADESMDVSVVVRAIRNALEACGPP